MESSRELNDYERELLANVAERGFQVTTVFASDDFPTFSYSIGFPATVGQGEVITIGLHSDAAYGLIEETLNQCRDGLVLRDGLILDGTLGDYPVVVKVIPADRITKERFNSAMWFHDYRYGTPLTEAFQLVWPCEVTRLFPWDAECPDDVISDQPLLFEQSVH
ncbi:MAG TPA: DUF4262 domain-containing protein [Croceibacterium sp.]|jgi:hypothetical protein